MNIKMLYPSIRVRIIAPYPFTHHFRVKPDEAGMPLLPYLRRRFPFHTETLWTTRVRDGLVQINSAGCHPDSILRLNDRVTHHNPSVTEPAVPDDVRVLRETPDWLLIYKPAPMPVHPGGRYNKNTLTSILEEMGHSGLKIVHRLDAVTSGIILFARSSTVAAGLQKAFTEGRVKKWYYALVSGVPSADRMTIDRAIMRKKGFVFTCSDAPEARDAQTLFEVMHRGAGCAIVKCTPITGRTHQIRLHLREWGHPVIDDSVYGEGGDDSSLVTQNRAIRLQSSFLGVEEFGIEFEMGIPGEWMEHF